MRDVRDLEVASVGEIDTTPDAVRGACALLVLLLPLMALRVWMVATQWRQFVAAYGDARGLDMRSAPDWVLAGLRTPGQWGVVLDLAATLVVVAALAALHRRWWGSRAIVIAVTAVAGADVVGSLAYPVPWWFLVAGVLAAFVQMVQVVLVCRPATTMHLRPEPATLKEFAESC